MIAVINWVDNINWPPLRVSKLTFRVLALRQSEQIDQRPSLWRRANARNVSFETFYLGQFTLSTQLIIPILPCYTLLPTQHHSLFRNLPLYKENRENQTRCFKKNTVLIKILCILYTLLFITRISKIYLSWYETTCYPLFHNSFLRNNNTTESKKRLKTQCAGSICAYLIWLLTESFNFQITATFALVRQYNFWFYLQHIT